MNSKRERRMEIYAVVGTLLALLAFVAIFLVPEVRQWVGLDHGPEPEPSSATSPGEVRFYNPEIDETVIYPSAFRLNDSPPELEAEPVSGNQVRGIRLKISNLGVSRMQVSIFDPNGYLLMVSAEFVSTPPEMTIVYAIDLHIAGEYLASVHDVRAGYVVEASATLDEGPSADAALIGNQPNLTVGAVTGRACDPEGALVPIIASQVKRDDSLSANIPSTLTNSSLHSYAEYFGVIDAFGDAYFPVVVHAEHCTGTLTTGIVVSIADRARIEIQVPN